MATTLFEGVVAFLDTPKERGGQREAMLLSVGAQVRKTFAKDVTHVLVHPGATPSAAVARSAGTSTAPVVWSTWVQESLDQQKLLDTKPYLVAGALRAGLASSSGPADSAFAKPASVAPPAEHTESAPEVAPEAAVVSSSQPTAAPSRKRSMGLSKKVPGKAVSSSQGSVTSSQPSAAPPAPPAPVAAVPAAPKPTQTKRTAASDESGTGKRSRTAATAAGDADGDVAVPGRTSPAKAKTPSTPRTPRTPATSGKAASSPAGKQARAATPPAKAPAKKAAAAAASSAKTASAAAAASVVEDAPSTTRTKSPAKSQAKAQATSASKSPAKSVAKAPAKSVAKSPAKVLAKAPAAAAKPATKKADSTPKRAPKAAPTPATAASAPTPSPSMFKATVVLTSIPTATRDIVLSTVKHLGGVKLTEAVDAATTHVIVGGARRTLAVLEGIARGCWILKPEWVFVSLEAGHWVDEAPYQATEWFAGAADAHAARTADRILFRSHPTFYIGTTAAPTDHVRQLITQLGGRIVNTPELATICLGQPTQRSRRHTSLPGTTTVEVPESWLYDCVLQFKDLPVTQYVKSQRSTKPVTSATSPEY